MFPSIFKREFSQKPLIKKYQKYRNIGKKLNENILKQCIDERSIQKSSQLLGISEGKTLVFESEEEANFLFDFNVFESEVDGKTAFRRYQEQQPKLSKIKTEILNAFPLNYLSLFKVTEVNPTEASVSLSNLLGEPKQVQIIDLGLSQTGQPGLLIFTRIIPFADFSMTSGMFAIFPAHSEKTLLKRYKSKMKKVKSNKESVQLFVTFFKLNRTEGLEISTLQLN